MKKFLQFVYHTAFYTSLSFTAALIIYFIVDRIEMCVVPPRPGLEAPGLAYFFTHFGEIWLNYFNVKIKVGLILQLMGLCLCISMLQYVFFSGRVLKKMSYNLRLVLFGVLCLGLCAAFAILCQWFTLDDPSHWVMFAIIFLLGFGGISLGFELYYRILGKKYNEALGRSRKESNRDETVNKP